MFTHEHETTVLDDLPVLVNYTVMGEDRPASRNGPAEYAEIEYQICDRRGRYAGWIEERMSEYDHQALIKELWEQLEESP